MTEPTRPAMADRPPTDGEVAARMLVRGHLDTTGLDDVTAKAVELLVAADEVAAASYHERATPRLWRTPWWWAAVTAMTVLVVLAVANLVLIRGQRASEEQRRNIARVVRDIDSCVSPDGECAKRGRAQTGAAVTELQRAQLIAVECADEYDGRAAIELCVARLMGSG